MRRVVVTGLGVCSSLGANAAAVLDALRAGRSGIVHSPEYAELGFRSRVHGPVPVDTTAFIDRKLKRFMGDSAAFNYLAMRDAIEDARLTPGEISNPRVGLIVGSGGRSTENMALSVD